MGSSNDAIRKQDSRLFRTDDWVLYTFSALFLALNIYAWHHVFTHRGHMHLRNWVGVYFSTAIGLWIWVKTIQAFQGRRLRGKKLSSPTA